MLSARPPIPEVQLAAAVIHRALEDALTPDERLARPRIIPTPKGPRNGFTVGLKPREREDAVRFLLDGSPSWSESRQAWCDIAGLDPARLQRRVLTQIPPSSIPADLRRALRLPPLIGEVAGDASAAPAAMLPELREAA